MKIIGSFLILFFTFFLVNREKSQPFIYPTNTIVDTTKLDTLQPIKEEAPIKDTVIVDSANIDTVPANTFFGIASFYSKNLDGTETATGEIFRHNKLTAASNRFKLNTWVRVTRIKNGRSIIVRINDRMHPRMDRKGRIVDLTIRGAQKLGFIKTGVTKVKVEIVPKGTLK
jgi:rare lipoprotein A